MDWHDARTAEPIDGPIQRYPLGRVLLMVHRARASGRLRLYDGEENLALHFREGAVVGAIGIPGILAAACSDLDPDLDLGEAVQAAMARGLKLDTLLAEAARRIGQTLASWCLAEIGMISFKPESDVTGHGVRVDQTLVAMLSQGLYAAEAFLALQKTIKTHALDPVQVLLPERSAEPHLGLDALGLRVLNLARTRPALQDLVAAATSGNSARSREVQHRIQLLLRLGLLQIQESPQAAGTGQTAARPATRPRTSLPPDGPSLDPRGPEASAPKPTPVEAPSAEPDTATETVELSPDQQLMRLQRRIRALQPKNAFQRLGFGDAKERPSLDEVEEAFRKLSRRFHPDAWTTAPEKTRAAVQELFSLLSEAVELLRRPRVSDEQWERNRCAQQGVPYVTDRDRTKAKLSSKKGERLFRNKDYAIAEACFHEARNKDPLTPYYTFMHAQAAFMARQMSHEEALRTIDGLSPEGNKQASLFAYTAGRILLISGATDKAQERFRKAVELDPENRDAQRELRLHAMRNEAKPNPAPFWSLSIPFLDRFKKKPSKEG